MGPELASVGSGVLPDAVLPLLEVSSVVTIELAVVGDIVLDV